MSRAIGALFVLAILCGVRSGPVWGPAPASAAAPAAPALGDAAVTRVLDRWARAVGGADALRRIETMHTLGVVDGHGVSGDLDEWQSIDGRHRQFIDFQGRWNVLTVFDGQRGWSVDADGVRHVLRGEDLAGEYSDAWLASLAWLFRERRAGTLSGVPDDAGSGAREERLLARPERGLPITLVFDGATGLPLRWEASIGGRTRVTAPLDWRRVDGVLVPFGFRQSTGDIRNDVSVVIREVRFNETPPPGAFAAPPGPPPDVRAAGERAALPVEFALGRTFVALSVNGAHPGTFVLDSGAPWSTLSEALARQLAVPITVDTTGVALGDAPPTGRRFVTADSLSMGGSAWFRARLEVEPLDDLSQAAGRRIDGRLGIDFLTRFVVQMDPGRGRMTLHEADAFVPEPGADELVLPLRLVKGLPTMAARLNASLPTRLLVRTNMRVPLLLAAGLAPALGLEPGSPGTRPTPLTTPAAGAALFTLGRVRAIQPGAASEVGDDLELLGVPAAVPPTSQRLFPAGSELGGLLGGELLNRFRWTLDLGREELRLDRGEVDRRPFAWDASGLLLRALPPDFRAFEVDAVLPGSPAAEVGLTPGDRLESLEGRPAAEWRLEELVDRLSRPSESVRLVVLRAGKSRKVALKLRPLL